MYARQVSMELKADSHKDFTHKVEAEILPLLHKQKGFRDLMTLVNESGKDVFSISLWDSKDHAEAYGRAAYPEVTKILSKMTEGTPRVKSYQVANSTFHKIAATLKAA